MSPEEAAWAAAGAPYPLAEVPKPTDLPDAVDTTSIPIIDPARVALIAALREVASRLEHSAAEASEGRNGAFEFYGDLEDALGTLAQDVTDIIHDLIPAPSTTRVVFTVRWDDVSLSARRFQTVAEALDLIPRYPSLHGTVVQRTITTTDWTEVTS